MKNQQNYETLLFNFFLMGCSWARLCRKNLLYYDFHRDNVIFMRTKGVRIIDLDDAEFLDFPKEIDTYAKALSNLFLNFGMDFGAAFRFGFITATGEVGTALFDLLYKNNGITPLNGPIVQKQTEADNLQEIYAKWNELVDDSFVGKITNWNYEINEFSYIELMQRHHDEYKSFKNKYKNNYQLIRHEYQVYFANGLVKENDFDIVASALALSQFECIDQHFFLSAYYFFIFIERCLKDEGLRETVKGEEAIAQAFLLSRIGIDKSQQLIDYVKHETYRLRIQKFKTNPYLEIWYWSDFSKANSIEGFFENRHYGCYRCQDCDHIDFFDEDKDDSILCASCGSRRTEQISLSEYLRLLENKYRDQDVHDISANDNTLHAHSDIKDSLPKLDNIAFIPLYISAVKQLEERNQYDDAIGILNQIDLYIQNNPSVLDENGYVIDTPMEAGGVFYSIIDPHKLLKLFSVENMTVKYDYESYIYYKRIELNDKKGDRISASQDALKLIEIANYSPRWVHESYLLRAYELLNGFYKEKGNNTEALTYSNVLFTYQMIEILENKHLKDADFDMVINQFLNTGISNASAGNISLARSCLLFSLKMHIYFHGSRHPDSAVIYHHLAKVAVRKKLYEDAYRCWAVSLILLDVRKEYFAELINDIEACISKSLSETGNTTLADWKKKWMEEYAFSVFPEKRYEKHESDDSTLPHENVSPEELFREYVAMI